MKKTIFAALAAVALVSASCSNCGSGSCSTKSEANDSLSTAYGNYVGSVINNEMNNPEADKAAFVKGLKMVMASPADQSGRYGMQVGLQMLHEINQLQEEGITLDKAAILKAFIARYEADSLSVQDIREAQTTFRTMFQQAQEEANKAAQAEMSAAADAMAATGSEQVAKIMSEDPSVATTESGLAYKIENAGDTSAMPSETATVKVHYTGKHLDGTVFDSSVERGTPATFNLQGVVPGFREGLMLLGKGGKATLYIPGNLAYGAQGAPQAGIQPNETLVFDVELLDIL